MGLRERIRRARMRKGLSIWFEAKDGERVLAQQIAKSNDGGLLVHVAIERAPANG